MTQIEHPWDLAAARLDDLDPAFVGRVVDELHAGPLTPARLDDAMNELAGLGHVVHVEVAAVQDIDGEWCAAGWAGPDRRPVWFVLPADTGAELAQYLSRDPDLPAFVPAPPTALMELPDGII